MPLQWASCPECGASFSTMTPGEPCSQRCAAQQAIKRAQGQSPDPVEPRYTGGGTPKRGTQRGPGPAPKGKPGCDLALVPAAAALLAAVLHLARRAR